MLDIKTELVCIGAIKTELVCIGAIKTELVCIGKNLNFSNRYFLRPVMRAKTRAPGFGFARNRSSQPRKFADTANSSSTAGARAEKGQIGAPCFLIIVIVDLERRKKKKIHHGEKL